MYAWIVWRLTVPHVLMNFDRVQRLGSLLLSCGYCSRSSWAVYPLIFLMTSLTPYFVWSISRSRWTWSGMISCSITVYPYSSCLSSISCFNVSSIPFIRTLRRYFGQNIIWYWHEYTVVPLVWYYFVGWAKSIVILYLF